MYHSPAMVPARPGENLPLRFPPERGRETIGPFDIDGISCTRFSCSPGIFYRIVPIPDLNQCAGQCQVESDYRGIRLGYEKNSNYEGDESGRKEPGAIYEIALPWRVLRPAISDDFEITPTEEQQEKEDKDSENACLRHDLQIRVVSGLPFRDYVHLFSQITDGHREAGHPDAGDRIGKKQIPPSFPDLKSSPLRRDVVVILEVL